MGRLAMTPTERDPLADAWKRKIRKSSGLQSPRVNNEVSTMSLKTLLDKSTGEGGGLINGSDFPAGTKTLTITVATIRKSPDGFGAPAIIDLKTPVYGKAAWPVNKTNLKALIKLFGEDESSFVGRKVKLEVISVRNPQSGDIVPGLAVCPKQ